jgi:hypothetical protein
MHNSTTAKAHAPKVPCLRDTILNARLGGAEVPKRHGGWTRRGEPLVRQFCSVLTWISNQSKGGEKEHKQVGAGGMVTFFEEWIEGFNRQYAIVPIGGVLREGTSSIPLFLSAEVLTLVHPAGSRDTGKDCVHRRRIAGERHAPQLITGGTLERGEPRAGSPLLLPSPNFFKRDRHCNTPHHHLHTNTQSLSSWGAYLAPAYVRLVVHVLASPIPARAYRQGLIAGRCCQSALLPLL